MHDKVTIAKKALNCLYLELHESIADDVCNKVNAAFEELRMETILDVQEALLGQINEMTYENGYPIKAVAQDTLLSLPAIMGYLGHPQIRNNEKDIVARG